MFAITILLLCALYLNHSVACEASPNELVVVPTTLFVAFYVRTSVCTEVVVNSQQKRIRLF